MKALVLTAGKGTRLAPITDFMPKPSVPVLNVPLVGYSIALLENGGVNDFRFNLYHLPEKMQLCLERLKGKRQFSYSVEKEILGSAGPIKNNADWLTSEGDFFLANGDEFFIPNHPAILSDLIAKHRQENNLATLLVKNHPGVGTHFGGVWVDNSEQVLGFGKNQTLKSIKGYHYTGYMIASPLLIEKIPSVTELNIFYDILVGEITKGAKVGVLVADGYWSETGNPQGLWQTNLEALQMLMPPHKYLTSVIEQFAPTSGFFMHDSQRSLVNSQISESGLSRLHEHNVIEDQVTEIQTDLTNCVAFENSALPKDPSSNALIFRDQIFQMTPSKESL